MKIKGYSQQVELFLNMGANIFEVDYVKKALI